MKTSPFKSIRWRLQAWHGLMLLVVLLAFGVTSYYLAFENRMRRIDQELQRRAGPFVSMLGRFGGPPVERGGGGRFRPGSTNEARSSFERRGERPQPPEGEGRIEPRNEGPTPSTEMRSDIPRSGEPRRFEGQGGDMLRQMLSGAFPIPPDVQRLFDEAGNGHYYYVVWSAEHEEVKRSTNAPALIPIPENGAALTNGVTRTREDVREFIQSGRRGTVVLVGSHIASDRAELRRLAGLLALAGVGVLGLGLTGGWWLSSRAIRPIEDISATAVKIAGGDLSERIRIKDAASELEALAGVLNNTFERLDTAFARQVQFTADASHELRTPISVVLSQTQTALKRERSGEEYRETISACQRSAQRMGQLVESLLELARLDAGQEPLKREACDIERIARECVDLLQPLIQERKITVVQQLEPALCNADAQRLAQVITNLISNAVHYNRDAGSITVRTWSKAGSVCVSIADTGIGIPKDELPHVFERFYRVDKSRSNAGGRTGLGLAICKSIADAHNGKLEAVSELGIGTTFTLMLPAALPAGESTANVARP